MDEQLLIMLAFMEGSGAMAPFMFIIFHMLRQFMFIPVAVVCMAGGILFGSFLGTIYSLTGLLFLSAFFYFCIGKLPRTHEKLMGIKYKWFGRYTKMTVGQIAVLRLIPFFHYHLLNICLLERRPDFRGFMKGSFTNESATRLILHGIWGIYYPIFTRYGSGDHPFTSRVVLRAERKNCNSQMGRILCT